MTNPSTPFGTTPPGADDGPGGNLLPAAGATPPTTATSATDFHPHSRTAQLAEAEAVLNTVGSQTDATLRRACRLIIDLSRDHALRQRAQDLMQFLED